mgnify:CR=1 FL=1
MLNIHKIMVVDNEHLYGPGKRILLYLQGCSIHCEGCVNQHLWPFSGGTKYETIDLIKLCNEEGATGFTIHGGEPLDQAEGLLPLLNEAKRNNLSTILFTGYTKKELNNIQKIVWNHSDLVVAGRFELKKRNVNLQFRGSTNQRVYRHKGPYKHYKIKDGYTTSIITIDKNGETDINGFLTDDIEELIR